MIIFSAQNFLKCLTHGHGHLPSERRRGLKPALGFVRGDRLGQLRWRLPDTVSADLIAATDVYCTFGDLQKAEQ
uniref:Uncharacterized protein n=1 Tax=Buteo japonicus TaxID=224669 RepID=A0A8C0B332_9AVES